MTALYPGFEEARIQMFELARTLRVGCLISARIGNDQVVVDSVGASPAEVALLPGFRTPLNAPLGSIFFAWASQEGLQGWIDRSESRTKEDQDRFLRTVAAVRARGYSVGGSAEIQLDLEQMIDQLTQLSSSNHSTERVTTLLAFADMVRRTGATDHTDPGSTSRFVIGPIFDQNSGVVATLTLFALTGAFDQSTVVAHAKHLLAGVERVTQSAKGLAPR
jgi:DNA-binding IclR family transcriptional regulator